MHVAETRSFIIPKRQQNEERNYEWNEREEELCVWFFSRSSRRPQPREIISWIYNFRSVLLLSSFHLQWKMSSLPNRVRNELRRRLGAWNSLELIGICAVLEFFGRACCGFRSIKGVCRGSRFFFLGFKLLLDEILKFLFKIKIFTKWP